MAILLKSSSGKLLKSKSGKYLEKFETVSVYTQLMSHGDNIIELPNGVELLINYNLTSYEGEDVPYLSFSADFDLVVCTDERDIWGGYSQWGTYEIYGENLLSCPILIYDHNNYEHGDLIQDNIENTIIQNYKPIAVLYFDIGTDILTIRDREV